MGALALEELEGKTVESRAASTPLDKARLSAAREWTAAVINRNLVRHRFASVICRSGQ